MLNSVLTLFEAVRLQSVFVFLFVFLLGLYWTRLPKNLPPGPTGWPVIGSALALRRGLSHHVFTHWSKQYGEVFSVRLGGKLVVVLNDLRCIKDALHKQADVFSDRHNSTVNKLNGIKGAFSEESGDIWKARRRFGLGALRSFGMGKKSNEHSINEESRYLLDGFADEQGKPFNPTHQVEITVSNVICKMCVGRRFNFSDPDIAEILQLIRQQLSYGTPTSLINYVPGVIHTPFYSHVKTISRRLKEHFSCIVREHRDSYDKNDIRDIIDLQFAEVEKRETSGRVDDRFEKDSFDDVAMRGSVFDLFVGGTETTSTTLLWLMMLMALHPNIQRKVQSEIDDVIGGSRQPSMADSPNMPYTNAAILETLRIRPAVPLAVPHQTKEETLLNGYTVPRNTCVLINILAVHHDPATWTEPEKYNPARFLSADGKSVVQHESFIPFGTGRRRCMGESLARTELFLIFVNLLQQFSLKFPAEKPLPSEEGLPGIILKPGPFEICVTRRTSKAHTN
ncbi:cytochrome P450 2U1-like [Asterias rubens]|uniref:cytochrome P450 2U1-like n=1 Tax=Asterias rubens TaxID=7604 RepID=UPI00145565B7|nr:cytochrome P450 2U1-like [Asterias rubens]